MDLETITPAKSVAAAHDSVDLINALLLKETRDAADVDTLARNAEHLKIICAKEWAADFASDTAIFEAAIAQAEAVAPSAPKV